MLKQRCHEAYFSGQSAQMSSTMALSLDRISVWRRESLAFFCSSSKEMTMYSSLKDVSLKLSNSNAGCVPHLPIGARHLVCP